MRITAKLKLAALVPALVALAIGIGLYFSFKVVQDAQAKDRAVQRIIAGMNELSSVIGQYVLHREEPALQHFMVEHDSITRLIATTRFSDTEQQQLLESVRRSTDLMKIAFLELVSNRKLAESVEGSEQLRATENRMAARLLLASREVVSDASHLERLVDEEITRIQKRINFFIFVSIALMAIFLSIVLMGMMRSTNASLLKLREGTELVATGNLDHRIGLAGGDEIGELSRSFDRMTEQLQTVTVSKNALQKEVAERKKAEDALGEQRSWLRVTLNSIGDAVIATDTAGRVTFLNSVAQALTGWQLPEAEGQSIRSVLRTINEHTHEPAKDIVKCVLEGGCVVNMANHTALVNRAGREIPIEDSAAPIKDDAGKVFGVVVVFHDVTEKRRAQEALRQSEKRYRSYIELTEQLGWTTDPNGYVVEDMPTWRRFTGQSVEEIRGWGWSKSLHPDDLEQTVQVWRNAVATKKRYETEYRIRRYDGVYRHFLARGVPVYRDSGEVQEWVGTCLDITERKMTEEAVRQSRDELERRVQERTAQLRKTNEELQQRNRDLEEFAHVASHDLQEPLRKVQTFADLLSTRHQESVDDKIRDYLERMRRAAGRMQALVQDLLKYSRVISTQEPFARFNLKEPVEEAVSDLGLLREETGGASRWGIFPRSRLTGSRCASCSRTSSPTD